MSNTERKARKRAGIPLHREPKVGTPLEDRAKPVNLNQLKSDEISAADAARARRATRTTDAPAGRTAKKSTASRKTG